MSAVDFSQASRLSAGVDAGSGEVKKNLPKTMDFAELIKRAQAEERAEQQEKKTEKEKPGFWTQRAESHKEFMELQAEAARKQRLLMKLRQNGKLSAAELLLGII